MLTVRCATPARRAPKVLQAVSHKPYLDLPVEQLTGMLRKGGLLLDVKSALESGAGGGGRAVLESVTAASTDTPEPEQWSHLASLACPGLKPEAGDPGQVRLRRTATPTRQLSASSHGSRKLGCS